MKDKNKTKQEAAAKAEQVSTSQNTVAEKPQASVADVDNTTNDIDSVLSKLDDNKDFSATDLSDTSLNL
jgi:hypothetical protein